jgi:hypothetical protein
MTPDSGCFSVNGLNQISSSLTDSDNLFYNSDLPIDANGSYLTYISTFALHNMENNNSKNFVNIDEDEAKEEIQCLEGSFMPCTSDLSRMNSYELNDLIEQIETNTKSLSDTLVQVNTEMEVLWRIKNKRDCFNEGASHKR